MKFLTGLALLLLTQVSHAQAAPQTSDCGANIRQVTDIIRSKFLGVFDANYAQKFIGSWGNLPLLITPDGPFTALSRQFMVCPQRDRTFYGYEIADPSIHANLVLVTDTHMVMSNCSGSFLCGVVEGDYVKKP